MQDLPVVALSGQPDVSAADYLNKGFSGSLMKPYSSQNLLKIIGDLLHLELKTKPAPAPAPPSQEKGKIYTLTEIRNFSGEDPEAMDAILTAFIESTKSNLLALELAAQKGQKKKVSAVAHKMLPMFRQLQVPHIIEQLAILEDPEEKEQREVNISALSKEINELLESLQEEITG